MNSKELYLGIHIDTPNYKNILDALHITHKKGANIMQIFLGDKTLTTLREKFRPTPEEIKEFKSYLKLYNMKFVVHAILRLNYCNDPKSKHNLWGLENLIYDMNLCHKLGGIGCVVHMGTFKTKRINITYDQCMTNYVNSLIAVLDKTKKIPIILETPVNRTYIIGGTTEDLGKLFHLIPAKYRKRIKTCIDTQHIFASGYDLRDVNKTAQYFHKYDKSIGIKNIALIHLNDSAKEFNSGIDRHETIGKGYIFSKDNLSITYIINFAKQHNIPLILETNYEYFNNELRFLKSLQSGGRGKKKDIKKTVLKILKEVLLYYETLGKKGSLETKYKIESYKKALKTLEDYDGPIYSSNDVKNLPYIGKGFCEKINKISQSSTLNIYENIKKNTTYKSLHFFQNIWGIGPEVAQKIVDQKIFTLKELKRSLKEGKIILTDQQLLGIKYYEDLKRKIPRDLITKYTNLIKKLVENSEIKIYNAGSYRAGKSESGDIDLILTYSGKINAEKAQSIFYNTLKEDGIISETLSTGMQKSMYIVKFEKYYHKIDIIFIIESQLPWYQLYFGSSRDFSKKMRSIVAKMGYKLSEKGLFDRVSGKKIDFFPKDEKDIFDYLKLDYVKPEDRL
jgi:apurinic endonuclease APN1